MPISSRPAVAAAPAGLLIVVAVLAACAQEQPLPADPTGRLFARGLDEISELYLEPASSRLLALDGADRLTILDHGFRLVENPGPQSRTEIVLHYGDHDAASQPEPAADDAHGWGALLGRLVAGAKAVSPSVAALSDDRLETAVFSGITGRLDRFSHYDSPEAAGDQRALRDGFGGIGVSVENAGGGFRIVSLTPGGPAELGGLRRGDQIVAIDGEPTTGLTKIGLVRRLRGSIPSTVEISVLRPGDARRQDFRIRRTLIVLPSVSMSRAGDVAVFRVSSFNQNTTQQLVHALAAAQGQEQARVHGIILDLRDDSGGLLDQAVSLADLFILGGPIAATTGRHPASRQFFAASGNSLVPHLPIVVLINGGSASASEVVAAALQDAGRAVVIGSSSYGKGTVQTVTRLPNGGELTLTWALLVAPSGYLLNGHGVVPTLCTSDLGDDGEALRIALQRAGAVSLSPLTPRPRSSLSEADWSQLRRSCPERLGDRAIDLTVAERLLADPDLFSQAVHVIAPAAKLAAGTLGTIGTAVRPDLTGNPPSLLSGSHAP
jgi:carboxyl-terminal processing protease